MSTLGHERGKSRIEVLVELEPHDIVAFIRTGMIRSLVISAAKASAARMSARVSWGYAARISCSGMPSARLSTISETQIHRQTGTTEPIHLSPDVRHVLSRLDAVRRSGAGWVARCPAHEDREPSLSVGIGREGHVLLHCFAGCAFPDIVAALDEVP